ncbi:hypothetical protein L3X38_008913 [Prunus dulcis]|uniref:TIR domain-containing protein n=1 Tax=Prunus dulcis TaxID=3755 RepID=A0AAD4ZXD7_PRUDU|nr:hypothetical protein L3X38_008913 [Prunus dulcis]
MDAASTSLEASSSSSPSNSSKHWKYEVFLSFSGEDTRRTFIDHLYCTLKDNGMTARLMRTNYKEGAGEDHRV